MSATKNIVIFYYEKLHALYWDIFKYCHLLIVKYVFRQAMDMDWRATISIATLYCKKLSAD